MKKTPESVLHAKVPAIVAAALCGILPPRKDADELKVPRAPCFADENVHLAISWTGDHFEACRDLGPKVVEGFISATPIDRWGDACPKHRAIGAAIAYKVNGENCTRLITWDGAAPGAKNRTGMFFLRCGHAVASRYPLVEDRFVAWPDCRQQYAVKVTPGRYSFQVPPADHFTVAESKASDQVREEQSFTPRTEPSEVQPAKFEAGIKAKPDGILHVKTSLIRMAIAIGLVPGKKRSAAIVLPANAVLEDLEAMASISWNAGGNPYRGVAEEASRLVAGFKGCEPIGGRGRVGRTIDAHGIRIRWAEQGDAAMHHVDLTWWGRNGSAGNLPRGWVLARYSGGDWTPIAPMDRYRADSKPTRFVRIPKSTIDEMVAHARECAAEPESTGSALRGPDLSKFPPDHGLGPTMGQLADEMVAARLAQQMTPAQRRSIAAMLLKNRQPVELGEATVADAGDPQRMIHGWRDESIAFLAPHVPGAVQEVRESLGLELVPDAMAANLELSQLLADCGKLRATAEAAIATIGSIHDRIDEISRWLANPVGDYPARPIAFAG